MRRNTIFFTPGGLRGLFQFRLVNPTNIANNADKTAWSQFMAGPLVRTGTLWAGFVCVSGFVCVPNLRSKDSWQWAGSVCFSTQSGVSKLRTKDPFVQVVNPCRWVGLRIYCSDDRVMIISFDSQKVLCFFSHHVPTSSVCVYLLNCT